MFFVYILYSESHSRYYVGQTNDLERRVSRHNLGKVFATKPYLPWKLDYVERYATRSESLKREKEIKRKKSRRYLDYLVNPDGHRDGCRD